MIESHSLPPRPRFGIWAPYRGKWVIDPKRERLEANFDLSRETVLSAEKAGFDTVLFAQHTINPLDQNEEILEAWTAAAAAAAVTERIEIIAAIKPRLYHPVVLAKMALGIEDISRGRFAVNLVNAWFKPELERSGIGFLEHDDRYAYGFEWARIVKALVSGETVSHRSANFDIQDYALRPQSRFRKRPHFYMGGESAPGRVMANELADVWLINGRALEDGVAEMIADMRARPRSGEPLQFGTTGFSLTRATEAEAFVELERLYGIQDTFFETRRREMEKNIDQKVVALKAGHRPGVRMIGANGGVLPGFVGGYDQVARRFVDFYDTGVTTFLLSFFPLIEEQERFASEIIPRVHALIEARQAKPERVFA